MSNKTRKLLILLIVVQIFGEFLKVESNSQANHTKTKGKGKAFAAGILTGGLVGAATSYILTKQNSPTEINHHIDPNADVPNQPSIPITRPPTIIERADTLPSGCYKQTVKEPDAYDVTRFIETEQLICPPNLPAPVSPTYVQQLPFQSQPVVPAMQAIPVQPLVPELPAATHQPLPLPPTEVEHTPQSPNATNATSPNIDPVHIAPLAPLQPVLQMPGQPVPVVGQYPPQPAAQPVPDASHTPHPVIPHPELPASSPSSNTSQVIVLSKKYGFYEEDNKKKHNAGNSWFQTNFISILLAIAFTRLV